MIEHVNPQNHSSDDIPPLCVTMEFSTEAWHMVCEVLMQERVKSFQQMIEEAVALKFTVNTMKQEGGQLLVRKADGSLTEVL